MKALPREIYVAIRESGTDNEYLVAEVTPEEAIEDDGPTRVGTYRLISQKILVKRVVAKK